MINTDISLSYTNNEQTSDYQHNWKTKFEAEQSDAI